MAGFPAFEFPPADPDGRRFGISLLEQLEQFRRRLIRSAIGIVVGMLVAFVFIDRIVAFVLAPARRMLPPARGSVPLAHRWVSVVVQHFDE